MPRSLGWPSKLQYLYVSFNNLEGLGLEYCCVDAINKMSKNSANNYNALVYLIVDKNGKSSCLTNDDPLVN